MAEMQKIPLILITGFLGSGKTTFINWLLQKHFSDHISVIVNEFGTVQLEKNFITQQSDSVVELANGCMCCVAKSDIPRVVSYILEHSPQTQYIIVEASGLSDPDPIKEALERPPLNSQVYLQKTIAIIDTENFLDTYQKYPLLLSQAADADVLMLSKLSLTEVEKKEKVTSILKANLQLTPIIEWTDNADIHTILSYDRSTSSTQETDHHHLHEDFEEFWFRSDKRVDTQKFLSSFHSLKETVYRAKGIFVDEEGNVKLVQYVNGKTEVRPYSNEEKPVTTTVLFLGKHLDKEQILNTIQSALLS